ALQALSAVGAPLARVPGARALTRAATGRLLARTGEGPDEATRRRGGSLIVAVASDADGRELAKVQLRGPDPYTLTAGLLAWGAQRAATAGIPGTGALGPVDAFGLEALEQGAAAAGLERADR
ncbi:MAG TPA: saccharopine dehydrogenase, partial [Actinomycetes bacterium]|nr:saccharopine dehydrogenase [Actinomycetes bacterium]